MMTALAITALLLRGLDGETCVGRIEARHGNTVDAVEAVQTAPFSCAGAVSFRFDVTGRGAGGRSTGRQSGTVALTATETVLGKTSANHSGSAVLNIAARNGPEAQCRLDYNALPAAAKSSAAGLR